MRYIDDVFSSIIGEMAWSIRRGQGSWLSMEFGRSHLHVREPIQSTSDLPSVRQNAARRRVFVHGQKHFLIMDSAWTITVRDLACTYTDTGDAIDPILKLLDGQRLATATFGRDKNLALVFDLGGKVGIRPYSNHGNVWSLHDFDGGCITTMPNCGDQFEEQTQRCDPGSIILS
jgi:hypothetical protein